MTIASLLLLSGASLTAAHCAEDNCLRALNATQTPGRLASAQAFCASFTCTLAAANTSVPDYALENCNGASGPVASSRLSSACSCIAPRVTEASSIPRPVFVTVTTSKFPCFNTTTTRVPVGTGTGIGTSSAVVNPTLTSAYGGERPTGEPCATISEFWAKEVAAANPNPSVDAKLAYECLRSVPLHTEAAIALVDAIRPYLEWQSDLAYLKDPPVGYEPKAFDPIGHLQRVRERLVADAYDGEVDFQEDLFEMTAKTRDGHFAFLPDALTGVFQFSRPFPLVSYAKDPLSTPVIKIFDEVKAVGNNASTVLRINGVAASAFIQGLADRASPMHDPDAAYNQLFYSQVIGRLGIPGTFQKTGWHNYLYPGENTTVEYTTGEVRTAVNLASIQKPFFNITNGESFYQRFCVPALGRSVLLDGAAAPTAPFRRSVVKFGQDPEPVVKSYDNAVSGYYLNSEGFEDVAILEVAHFTVKSSKIFQKTVDSFFEACKKAGKSRIIVDLQMNPGGYILQGSDLFRQFFPQIEQDAFTRWRQNDQFRTMAEGYSAAGENIEPGDRMAIGPLWHNQWNYRTDLNMTNQPFESFEAKFAPWTWAGDAYTALIRDDLNDSHTTTVNFGIDITGYGSRKNFTQPFESRDIVLLTDGFCASTCSVFASGMKIQGNVKTIVMGGRPNGGLMQGIGGTKGAQVLTFERVFEASRILMDTIYTNLTSKQEASLSQLTSLPFERSTAASLNVRDQILRNDINTGIPAQFVNEPADCRLYWTLGMLSDVREIWKAAANSAWNGGGCVAGTGFGKARPGVLSSVKATGAATRPQTKVISALDVGLDQDALDREPDWRPETLMF
ncbi:hypothetical protein CGRA01v4_12488 [Colletotrichum graminicola]|uniref:Uncharacterized protein n=1 Tax=Colletotrichum graminicola (strain M1.001 / M2 / FGSC 10212) TaxID=645133 RepID=E3QT10_COLGM|nr:uncharacterized protein GLRG_09142 [Colletotrichum graminicola M1.001]EFQ33998.1 hypothetical protein GLRG_09142 [Colletotrichum graminicola M1.001]WDK21199.1 hypothetical protein CGRA01v4_12488 [Colletotrichum graminicola]